MQIKMLEKVVHDGAVFEKDEVRSVDDAVGQYFCGLGWAEDTAGIIATGERKPGVVVLDAHDQISRGV